MQISWNATTGVGHSRKEEKRTLLFENCLFEIIFSSLFVHCMYYSCSLHVIFWSCEKKKSDTRTDTKKMNLTNLINLVLTK